MLFLLGIHHHLYCSKSNQSACPLISHLLRVRDIKRKSRQLVKPSDIHHIIDETQLHTRVHLHELVEHRLRHDTADDAPFRIFEDVVHC